ncbi:MAG: polyketide cyclase [Verrucomicrobiae bacterium]|nr:polyketide cyclase [Verrucomicrobiae bacterium]
MASHDYVFLTRWRVRGCREEAYDVLFDALDYVRWWPDVYLEVRQTAPARADGTGRQFRLLTKGKLPYRLRWSTEIVEASRPQMFTLRATGDFEGRGIWSLRQEGEDVAIEFDWRLRAEKPLLRSLSFCLKPLFSWNHRWAMARGEESLQVELARRHRAASRT